MNAVCFGFIFNLASALLLFLLLPLISLMKGLLQQPQHLTCSLSLLPFLVLLLVAQGQLSFSLWCLGSAHKLEAEFLLPTVYNNTRCSDQKGISDLVISVLRMPDSG